MPELPEVETIRCCLQNKVTGRTIKNVWIRKGSRLLRDTLGAAALRNKLLTKTIEAIGRRGKYLIFALSSGDFLVVHLGMTGQLYTAPKNEPRPKHAHLRLDLGDENLVLLDPRTFGRLLFIPAGGLEAHPALMRLGPEPLDPAFSEQHIREVLSNRKTPLKSMLLGQALAAGIGNIYADEACYRARINPLRMAGSISDREIKALRTAIRKVIRESIECKGTTIRDYRWDAGRSGDFKKRLRVYGREGKACRGCGKAIKRVVVTGRSTFFCPACQKQRG